MVQVFGVVLFPLYDYVGGEFICIDSRFNFVVSIYVDNNAIWISSRQTEFMYSHLTQIEIMIFSLFFIRIGDHYVAVSEGIKLKEIMGSLSCDIIE